MLDLRSAARRRLLVYYFTNPTARRHLRDLAERLDIDPSNLSKGVWNARVYFSQK
jgi:DNA-binding MarR family transcriptional regulator